MEVVPRAYITVCTVFYHLTDVEASGDTLDGVDYYFGLLEQFSEVE